MGIESLLKTWQVILHLGNFPNREDANGKAALAKSTSLKEADHSNNNPVTGCRQHVGYKKGMAIASLKVNGLRNHLDEVQLLINNLGIHFLALNETKLDPNYPIELTSVAGYQQERPERTLSNTNLVVMLQ